MFHEVHFEIENKCLLDCRHCSSKDMRKLKGGNKYSTQDIKNIVNISKEPTHIYFTGGEPLLNDNIHSIMRTVKLDRPDVNIGIFTCGVIKNNNKIISVSYEEAMKLKESGLNNCYLSIYGEEDKEHDVITNRNGIFDNVIETINNLLKVGILVKVHLVINKYNILKLDSIIKYLEKIGVNEVRLLRLVKSGSAIENWDDIGIEYSEQNKAIHKIIDDIENYKMKITISGFPDSVPCRPFDGAYKCQAGSDVLYVTYDGDVYPCACTKSNNKFKIGHISDIDKIKQYRYNLSTQYNDMCLNPIKEI